MHKLLGSKEKHEVPNSQDKVVLMVLPLMPLPSSFRMNDTARLTTQCMSRIRQIEGAPFGYWKEKDKVPRRDGNTTRVSCDLMALKSNV